MGRMRHGVHPVLEAEADALLAASLQGVTAYSEKSDILTPWKVEERRRREILTKTGVVDPALVRGNYRRAFNERDRHLNAAEAVGGSRSRVSAAQDPDMERDRAERLYGWESW